MAYRFEHEAPRVEPECREVRLRILRTTTPAPAVGWVGGQLHEVALDVAEGEPPAVPARG